MMLMPRRMPKAPPGEPFESKPGNVRALLAVLMGVLAAFALALLARFVGA